MTTAQALLNAITDDFLYPTMRRLSEQLNRNITLDVALKFDEIVARRKITIENNNNFQYLEGEVRILSSDTAVKDRYKYELQCIFPESEGLDDFSGLRLMGAIIMGVDMPKNDYSGFAYTYNVREWGKKFRYIANFGK